MAQVCPQISNSIRVYTDGSCLRAPKGPAGWAAIIIEGAEVCELAGHEPAVTNNEAEMLGLLHALDFLKDKGSPIDVFTDSRYLIEGVTQFLDKWRAEAWTRATRGSKRVDISSKDLWIRLDELLKLRNLAFGDQAQVSFRWVRAHSGEPHNERADYLAGSFARKKSLSSDATPQV